MQFYNAVVDKCSNEPNLVTFAKVKSTPRYISAMEMFRTSATDVVSASLPPWGLTNVTRTALSLSELERRVQSKNKKKQGHKTQNHKTKHL